MRRDRSRSAWTAVFVLFQFSLPRFCDSLVPISSPFICTGRRYSFLRTHGNTNNDDDHVSEEPAVKTPVSAFEKWARQVTGRSEYRFGDLTKTAVEDLAKATHLVEDDYQFGVSICASLFVK